jgi:hypothetical protein
MRKLAELGISKDRQNAQQGYRFRGIDDVYNTLSSVLAECGLVIVPQYSNHRTIEKQTQKGGTLNYTFIDGLFEVVSVEDGSILRVATTGEAMDSGDKSTNKAMSAAYKYMAMQLFCIPTEGDNDADATTHTVVAVTKPAPFDLVEIALEDSKRVADRKALAAWWERVRASGFKGEDYKMAHERAEQLGKQFPKAEA